MVNYKSASTPIDLTGTIHRLKVKHMLKCFSGCGLLWDHTLLRVQGFFLTLLQCICWMSIEIDTTQLKMLWCTTPDTNLQITVTCNEFPSCQCELMRFSGITIKVSKYPFDSKAEQNTANKNSWGFSVLACFLGHFVPYPEMQLFENLERVHWTLCVLLLGAGLLTA